MSFPVYPEYKDSGVDWMGEVPSHWGVKKFRYLFKESGEKIEDEVVGEMLSVSGYRGIEVKEYEYESSKRTEDELVGYRIVRPGQLVVNTMWLNYAGLGVSDYEGHVSPAYRSYWIDGSLEKRYIHHLMRSEFYVSGYKKYLTGIRPNSLQMSRDDMMSFPILVPSHDEQKTIAAFLDHETARIDALIDEQNRLIKLLKEKRQAVISHAVTKGLDPNVPMKDSGVEWLGEVPAHWGVSRLGHYASILNGYAFPSAEFSEDESDVKLLRGVNVGVSRLRWDDTAYWDLCQDDGLAKYLLSEGQIVIGMDRPWIGDGLRIARVRRSDMPCLLLQRVAAISSNHYVIGDYLFDLLASDRFRAYIEPDMTGVSVPHISPEQVLSFVVPIPPVAEQRAISGFLEKELLKIDGLLSESEEGIKLLSERRSALISATVTGKIDVRDWQPPASNSFGEQSATEGASA